MRRTICAVGTSLPPSRTARPPVARASTHQLMGFTRTLRGGPVFPRLLHYPVKQPLGIVCTCCNIVHTLTFAYCVNLHKHWINTT
jgi:hypothetical protein